MILLIVLFIMHSVMFFKDIELLPYGVHGFKSNVIIDFSQNNRVLGKLLSIIILFFQAIYINRMVIINKMSNQITLFPGLIFIIGSSLMLQFIPFQPMHLSGFFLTLSMTFMLYSYQQRKSIENVFNTGFWMGWAIVLYPPLIVFGIGAIFCFNILRQFHRVEYQRYFIGLMLPIILIAVYAYLTDQLQAVSLDVIGHWFQLMALPDSFRWEELLVLILFAIGVIVSLFSYGHFIAKKTIQSQKAIGVLFSCMLFIGLSTICAGRVSGSHLLILLIPLSIFISELIVNVEKSYVPEIFIWLVIILCFALQYQLF